MLIACAVRAVRQATSPSFLDAATGNESFATTNSKQRYRGRQLVKNAFCRLKDFRRIATHYDKLTANFLRPALLAFEQIEGRSDVTGLPWRSAEAPTVRVGQHVALGRQPHSGTPQRLILAPPFFGRCLLVGANDGAADHQPLIVPIGRQRLEYALPNTGMAPAADAGAPSCTCRSVPAGRTNERQSAEPTDIRSRTSGYPTPSERDQPPCPEPATQPATIAPRSTRAAWSPSFAPRFNTDAYELAFNLLGNPECRYGLVFSVTDPPGLTASPIRL